MTETQGSGAGSTLGDDVRRALLELVEKGFAGAQHLRALAAEAPAQLTTKSELLSLLDARIGTEGLTVTAGTLTNLAVINQIYGFAIGDLLQELTRSTTVLVLREEDPAAKVAQIAGAQFVIVHGATDQERVAVTVQRLQQACNAVALNPHSRSIVPRVAMVSLTVPHDDGLDAAEVLKILGYSQLRSRPSHLAPVFLGRDVDHTRWRASLRQRELKASRITDALRRGAVEINFQPVVELTTRNLYNVEVLARIRTDDGLMAATEFIDSVYQLGEIVELDSQVFHRLGEVASKIAAVTSHLFVNVSPVSLLSSDFRELMSRTMESLRAEGLGTVVVLELNEQAIIEHLDIIQELHRLHNIKFAVDDFGTGYSSIKTVSDLAVSKVISHLKLDGSLVRELGSSREAYKVVLAIANLARSLDLKVVAEHVESEAILDRLRTIGVELGQGRLFDMPLPLPGLVEEYRDRPSAPTTVEFDRRELTAIEPYLERAFTAFYDRLLSSEHFASFFRDREQIADLVQRQRASFIASMSEPDAALRERYLALGRLHHQLGVPFPSFEAGAEILNEELLGVLAHAVDHGPHIYRTSLFFKHIKNLLARGYLDALASQEEPELLAALDALSATLAAVRAPRLDWVRELLVAVRLDRHRDVPRPHQALESAVERVAERLGPHVPPNARPSIMQIFRNLHVDADSLAHFLEAQQYRAVVVLYRQLHDRVMSLSRLLAPALPGDRG
jgi:EAL domain-containing protein (putative c-di-GMP-specific phosphodiesterase class I)/GGDEF domain-containing protein